MNIKSPNLLLTFLAPEYGLGVRNPADGFAQQLSLGQESAATCHPSLYIRGELSSLATFCVVLAEVLG